MMFLILSLILIVSVNGALPRLYDIQNVTPFSRVSLRRISGKTFDKSQPDTTFDESHDRRNLHSDFKGLRDSKYAIFKMLPNAFSCCMFLCVSSFRYIGDLFTIIFFELINTLFWLLNPHFIYIYLVLVIILILLYINIINNYQKKLFIKIKYNKWKKLQP